MNKSALSRDHWKEQNGHDLTNLDLPWSSLLTGLHARPERGIREG
jgi:hypothetical protein